MDFIPWFGETNRTQLRQMKQFRKSLPTFDEAGRLKAGDIDLESPKPLRRLVVRTVLETHPGLI
jgi:hypothetical protein